MHTRPRILKRLILIDLFVKNTTTSNANRLELETTMKHTELILARKLRKTKETLRLCLSTNRSIDAVIVQKKKGERKKERVKRN